MNARTPNSANLTEDNASQNLVFDNLGLNADDLGLNNDDAFLDDENDLDGGDDGADNNRDDDTRDDVRDNRRGGNEDDDFELPPRQQRQQQQRRSQQREEDGNVSHTTLHSRAEVKADGKGNLVNAQGVIVARAGKEARLYQRADKAERATVTAQNAAREIGNRFNQLAGEAQKLVQVVKDYQARDQQLQNFKVTPQEQLKALQMFVELRDDGENALKKLLTRAAASGIDMTKLGLSGSGADTKSLLDLVRGELHQQMEPLRARAQQDQEQQQFQERRIQAETTLNNFLSANPNARQYLPAIHEILKQPRFQHLTLDSVWDKIQLNLLRNPELRQQRPSNSRRGMPSGRGAPRGGNTNQDHSTDTLASIDASYDDIVRDALSSAV